MDIDKRKINEIEQGKQIVEKAEFFWGWGTPAGKLRAHRRAELLIEYGEVEKDRNVLEVGCGIGVFASKLAATGAKITGIDISDELIKRAKTENSHPGVTYEVADVEKLPFPDNYFDIACGCAVLHHLNMDLSIREIIRVLKKEGKFVFAEPNMANPQLLIQKNIGFIKRIMGDTPDETAFFKGSLKRFLENNGFYNVSIRPFDFLHPWTPEIMIPFVNKIGLVAERTPILKEISGSLLIIGQKK